MHLYEPYTFEWENCWEFQTTSPLKPLSQFCSNFIWSLLRVGEQKIAKMVVVRWPRWPPWPYMVKTFKNLLQNQGCLGAESLHKLSGTGDLPKLLKELSYVDIWPFYVKVVSFPMHLYEPYTLEMENCWEFQTTSPLKALSQFCSNFICSHLWVGKQKIAKIVAVRWPRWPPCPYMVKTFKNLLLRNALGLNLCTNHRGREVYQSCLKNCCKLTFDLFTARSSMLPYAFVWAP